MSSPVLGSYRGVRLANSRYTQSYATQAVLWSSPQDFAFQQKPWSLHLSMPHRQFMPCDWCPSIYHLWARASQRRALSKRINSPPPNRCIFNRNQSTQNKIQCQTHSPFTSPFWVWTKPEALNTSQTHRSPRTSGRSPLIIHISGCLPIRTSVTIQTRWRSPVFDHRLHLRLSIVGQLFEMRINSAFSNNSRIFRISNRFISMVKLFDNTNCVL